MTLPSTPPPVERGKLARAGWFVCGWLAVVVGGLGIILPGLPTTIFFIIAAACFGKSSPRFEQWVLNLPTIGPMVRDHRAGLGMPRRTKVVAIATMWTAITISALVLRSRWPIVAGIIALGLVGTAVIIWRVPLRERVLATRRTTASNPPDG